MPWSRIVTTVGLAGCSEDPREMKAKGGVRGGITSQDTSGGKRGLVRTAKMIPPGADGVVRSFDPGTGTAVLTDWSGRDHVVENFTPGGSRTARANGRMVAFQVLAVS